jgi:hypothetical protein
MTLDTSRPVQTRDGRKARIIATDAKGGDFPIIALVECAGGESTEGYKADGSYLVERREHGLDLINVPERRTVDAYVNEEAYCLVPSKLLPANCRFTYQGNKLIAAEVIGQ